MIATPARAALAAALLLGAAPARAQSFGPAQRAEIVEILRDALTRDPTILRDAIDALRADESAREAAATKAALARAKTQLADPADPVGGNPAGDVTVVEFYDVRCGYCKKLDPDLTRAVAEDRNIRRVYKDLPILGPGSMVGARATLAARRQNAYEKMRAALMRASGDITPALVAAEAKKLGLDADRLARDMDDPEVKARIDANLALANALGIQGTPAMVIGQELIPGAVGPAELKRAIAAARSGKS
jgi:protein-disulfide isomerase